MSHHFVPTDRAYRPFPPFLSFSYLKDEPPDQWDEEEQQEEKEKVRAKEKDLEYLFHKVVRDSDLDDYLKRDLQGKKLDLKYQEMLVRIMCDIHFDADAAKTWSYDCAVVLG